MIRNPVTKFHYLMQTAFIVYSIWTVLALAVLLMDAYLYREIDFSMATDAPHWSDSGWGRVLFYVSTLPLGVMLIILGLVAALCSSCTFLRQ